MSDYVPDELLIDILARLPVASLLRFKSVCKSWYSLITSPGFVTKHLSQSVTNTKRNGSKLLVRLYDINGNTERYLLLNDDEKFGDEYSEMKFPFKLPVGYFRVVGSFNGLLCVADDYFTDKPQIIIWNPSTRKSVTLPVAPKTKRPHMCVYGFGSHPATHEYEVIRIQYEMEEFELKLPPKVEIYRQGTRSWRGISSAAPSYRIFNYMWSQAFVDGAVHWVAFEPCAWLGGGVRKLILLFNMASESFSEFKLPPTLADQPPPSLSIKTFGQSLAVLCSGQRDSGGCCIWVMKEYGVAESWTKLFSSNLLGMPNKTLGFTKKCRAACPPFERLPYELVIEILARLPVVSLLRFESVCKSWYSLIASPSFITKHLNLCKNKLLVRLYNNDDEKERHLIFRDEERCGDEGSELGFPHRAPFANFRIVGSCNGLLCIWEDSSRGKPAIIVWNPSIRKSVTLPDRPRVVPHMFVLGFGAHPTTHEYKVVRIVHQKYPYEHEFQPLVELYTQGTESWRQLGSTFPPYCFIEYEASQAFVSGAVNWIATDPRVSPGYRPLIVSFDMRAETFSVLMLPPALADEKPASLSVKLFRESLVVLCDQQTGNNAYCIWVMKEYGVPESWTKLFSFKVNLPIVLDRALGVGENGKVLLSIRDELLLSSGDNRLLSYDAVTKAVTDTKIWGCSSGFRVEPFMETLVSVENQGGVLDRQLNPS